VRNRVQGWKRVLRLLTVVWAVASGTCGCGTIVTVEVSQRGGGAGCPAGYGVVSFNALQALGPSQPPRLIDPAGNNNGKVCGRLLPEGARATECVNTQRPGGSSSSSSACRATR
jgi:hypothetical protein